jgi:cytochrome c553
MVACVLSSACAVGVLLGAGGKLASAAVPQPDAREDLQAVLSAIPNLKRGAAIFSLCAECHGAGGEGRGSAWTPAIAGQHPRVLAKQLVDYRHGKRWDPRMEKIAGRHILRSTQEIADVIAYVGQLQPLPSSSIGSGEWARRGERLYGALCRNCHGAEAEGSAARFVPRLAGQRYDYLLRQLHDTVDGRRPGMAMIHERAVRKLDMEDLMGIADYLSRLPLREVQRAASASAKRQSRAAAAPVSECGLKLESCSRSADSRSSRWGIGPSRVRSGASAGSESTFSIFRAAPFT